MKRSTLALALLGGTLSAAGFAHAQSYPSKPVRILVGYAPGGGVDTTARIVAAALTKLWGTQVIVENRPGAAGNIATEITAAAPADGYTLMLCNIGTHGVTPARFGKRLTYDPIEDFAFAAKIGGVPNIFMMHPSMQMQSLKQYIAYAKSHPGKVNFGSSGVGGSPHMSIELLMSMTGIKIAHVPYKGAALALSDVMAGHIESSVGNLAGGPLSAVKAGRVRGLGVTSAKRNARLPEVPTFQEQGVADFDVTAWYGLCTQSKVTQPIIAKINADMNKLLASGMPLQKSLEEQAVDVSTGSPEEFVTYVKAEIAKWTKVVRDAKLEAK